MTTGQIRTPYICLAHHSFWKELIFDPWQLSKTQTSPCVQRKQLYKQDRKYHRTLQTTKTVKQEKKHTHKFQVIPLETRKLRGKWAKTCIRSHCKMSQLLPLGSYEKKCNRSFATLESFLCKRLVISHN